MTLLALLLSPTAAAGDVITIVNGCDRSHADADPALAVVASDDDDEEPTTASVSSLDHDDGDHLQLQYGTQFLPDLPGHHVAARFVGAKNAYVGGELRYLPASDVLWSGRASVGIDLLGKSDWDFTLGLFLGSAGAWDYRADRAILYAAPIAGTEIGLGVEGERLFGRYRWLAGWGGGPIDDLLTENELTFGFKVLQSVHLYGQYLVLSPGELDNESGVGLGVRVVL